MEVYNKNRDKNQSMHDEIREQNAKLKGAPLKEKFSYFMEYYFKITLGIVIAAVLIGWMLYSILSAPRDTAFAAFFFNCYGDSSNTELADSFAEHMGIDTDKHDVYIDSAMNIGEAVNDVDSYISIEKTIAVIASGELDIIVGDTAAVDYFARAEYLCDITAMLPEDLLEKYKDKLYYAEFGEERKLVPVGLYIDDSVKIKEHFHFYSEPILTFAVNSNSTENAVEFLKFLLPD